MVQQQINAIWLWRMSAALARYIKQNFNDLIAAKVKILLWIVTLSSNVKKDAPLFADIVIKKRNHLAKGVIY